MARMGMYGESGGKLWVVSHTEGLHLWEWQAACDEEAPGCCCGSCYRGLSLRVVHVYVPWVMAIFLLTGP